MNKSDSNKNNRKQIYYLSNKILFSNNELKISILDEEIIEFDFTNVKLILEDLKYILSHKKIIKTCAEIKNFENIKKKILKLDIEKFGKPKKEDYIFIEKTSQIEILSQILSTIKNKEKLEKLNLKINTYCENEKNEEMKINELIKNNISKFENINIEIKKSINLKKEDISKINKDISKYLKDISKIKNKKKELILLQENTIKIDILKNKINSFEKEIKKLEFKIEENKIETKILKNEIVILNTKLSNGETKDFNFIKYILTLGLIHWTKFSDNKYLKYKIKNKINKINYLNLSIEKKIHKINSQLKEKNEQLKKLLKEENIKFEKIEEEIEKLDKEIEKNNIKKLEFEKEKTKKAKIIKEQTDKFKDNNLKIEKLKKNKKNNTTNILKILKKINENRNKNIDDISNLINRIKKQKIDIQGERIIKL